MQEKLAAEAAITTRHPSAFAPDLEDRPTVGMFGTGWRAWQDSNLQPPA